MRTFIAILFIVSVISPEITAQTCTKDGDCKSLEVCTKPSSSCSRGVCICKSGYTGTSSGCKKARKMDESCSSNDICVAPGSECSSGKCKCKSNHKLLSSKKGCYPENSKLIGESCSTSAECLVVSVCTKSKCACPSGYKASSSYPKEECAPLAKSKGESCSKTEECKAGSYLTCTSSKCECPSNHVWKSVQYLGKSSSLCVHKDAKIGLPRGNECKEQNNSNGKYCSSGLLCVVCPGETIRKCHSSSASNFKINSVLFGVTIIILGMILNQ